MYFRLGIIIIVIIIIITAIYKRCFAINCIQVTMKHKMIHIKAVQNGQFAADIITRQIVLLSACVYTHVVCICQF